MKQATMAQLRHNIDALWPAVEAGVEAIVVTSSACTSMLADYGRLLGQDAALCLRVRRASVRWRAMSRRWWPPRLPLLRGLLQQARARLPATATGTRVAFQAPCSLQHALRLGGVIEPLLLAAGFTLTPVSDGQRCCGSAGTYSILQPQLSQQLLHSKVAALESGAPDLIATANIGCLHHIRSATSVPVRHWIELLAERLPRD